MSKGILETERLYLKPLSFKELLYISNDNINKFEAEGIFDSVRSAILKKLEKMKNINEENHRWYTYWLIINKGNKKAIGFIGFKGLPDKNGYTEVGYSISCNCRSKGFMTESLKILINWAGEPKACKGVIARVTNSNISSKKVLSNCNFRYVSKVQDTEKCVVIFK
ncbi:hypothetical protein CLOBY_32560 [Clostridium saccharobutylicum]|uniref:GNAT family N-acetyltransferase n=1 Tax=Clostridium saccharobutylicum TaxID=169679 RepID=UPI00098394F1|nr:GNAT family protein [Clostridium saccharobutylicum]AQS11102.1 hypothetical protein CLOBY_32560 [Clostridium saccharobutylicum]MBC2437559.1 GNAT family N-acetyltransferase [Clostridium saccharobutylicum]NSB89956.1 RimJ/RimL family protein N-acetyltransferase [Clostridium saccharobutylicum]NYC32102.1 RimJ/RimL family protein N-acetyltransferase [Clostridium saccharobutylicum]OOM14939.1 hypothetical protein CLSAB_30510 [Clostridium saccharobutylicum]